MLCSQLFKPRTVAIIHGLHELSEVRDDSLTDLDSIREIAFKHSAAQPASTVSN